MPRPVTEATLVKCLLAQHWKREAKSVLEAGSIDRRAFAYIHIERRTKGRQLAKVQSDSSAQTEGARQ